MKKIFALTDISHQKCPNKIRMEKNHDQYHHTYYYMKLPHVHFWWNNEKNERIQSMINNDPPFCVIQSSSAIDAIGATDQYHHI